MKKILLILFCFSLLNLSYAQEDFIQIETNKVLCLFSFLENASGQRGSSHTFREYIYQELGEEEKFRQLIKDYGKLQLEYSTPRQGYPDGRHIYLDSKDLMWIAASNARDVEDFRQRIIGYLPHNTKTELVEILKQIEPFYDRLIWKNEQGNISRIEKQLSAYEDDIENIFLRISRFYHTNWDKKTPFKIMLYPIPMRGGNTTAIPKGNALICSFLSHRENDYQGRLGVIIHEMCHILFGEQTADFQHQIDSWFSSSKSPYAKLAYTYIDEGLATVLGNGWAYEQIHGKEDSLSWYNNPYIDGFAHAMYPLIKDYMKEGKAIDQAFIDKAIEIFGQTFPKSLQDTQVLMNEIQLFANSEIEAELDLISTSVRKDFRIQSMWFSTPIMNQQSIKSFSKPAITKVFIVESKQAETLKTLDKSFEGLKIETPLNSIDVFKDTETKSPVIVINISDLSKLPAGMDVLARLGYLDFGKNYPIE
ncbi:MAG: hypothetical protein AAF696_22535 [Bacteroidota bacterium]